MQDNLQELLEAYKAYTHSENQVASPQALYEPVHYITNLGGKHMRPLLLLAATKVFSESWQKAIPAAYGVEMFHNFTLVHDDIMDAADLRRGQSSVHIKYGVDQAILSGDVMMLKSLQYISQSCGQHMPWVLDFVQTGIDICEGQQEDMDFERGQIPSLDEYLEMIKGKTAVLPAEALRLGSRIGGANEDHAQKLFEFGIDLGLAFQIQDDILDTFGDQEKVGKVVGGDIRQSKKTVLYILTLEALSSEDDKESFMSLYDRPSSTAGKVDEVLGWMNSVEVYQRASELKTSYHLKSQDVLRELSSKGYDISLLKSMSQLLLDRVN